MLLEGEADIGVATEAVADSPGLVNLPCYRWSHSVIVPRGHPLARQHDGVTLSQLSRYPIITYGRGYAFHFVEMFVPTLTREVVERERKGDG